MNKKLIRLAAIVLFVGLMGVPVASALMGGQGLMWLVLPNEPLILTVCWENPSNADPLPGEANQASGAERREWVRLALKNSWERESRILFVGWEQCKDENNPTAPPHTLGPRRPGSTDENIKVNITTSGGGQNAGHGSWGDHQQGGISINLHGSRESIEFLAIHEFGHALGFYHEEERGDWPNIEGCPKQNPPVTDPWWPVPTELRWGAPDRDSVMAYCSGGPDELSPGDVAAVQSAYERHLPGTLLSLPGSLCLSAHADGPDGSSAFGWVCDEAKDDQEWRYDIGKQALYIQEPGNANNPRRCLDMDTVNNENVQIWSCNDAPNQQWQFRNVVLRGYGGLCVTRPAGGPGALVMQRCNNSGTQLWRIQPSALAGQIRIQSETGFYCLTRTGLAGSDAIAAPCRENPIFLPMLTGSKIEGHSAPQPAPQQANALLVQDFLMGVDSKIGNLSLTSPSLCLDVRDVGNADFISGQGGPKTGQTLQFFDCLENQLNQQWSFSGDVMTGDRCLTLTDGGLKTDGNAIVASCNGTKAQDWDYHW